MSGGERAPAVIWESEPNNEAAAALAERELAGSVFATGANRGAGDRCFVALMRSNLDDLDRAAETIATY